MTPLFIAKTAHGYMLLPVTGPDRIEFNNKDFPIIQCFDKLTDPYSSYLGTTGVMAAIQAHFEPKPEGEKS